MRALRARWLRSAALAMGAAALAGGTALAQPAQPVASNRVALVVGEGAYRTDPLPAAPDDAGLVAQVLAGAGFDVTGARDLDGDALRRAFRDFLDKAGAAGPDGIAVVYVAGRAVQADGDDFIVPVDARLARPADVPIEALRLADFTHALAALPIQARVVIVDGAYPGGPASSAPGLALAEAEQGELIAFNAAPGTVAPAATGPYGAYAQALVAAVKQGGVPVGEVFDRVRLAVNQATGGAVVPWDSDKLTRSFTFFDRAPNAPAVGSAQVPFAALEKRPLAGFPPDQAYDVAVARDTLPAYTEFLAAFPNDPLARRVRLILAVRREALFWRDAVSANTPGAYWTYLARYPKGPHAADARRRLTRLAVAAAPPPRFVPLAFDVPPPGPDDLAYDRAPAFDAPDLPPPPPPPVFLLPPPVEVVVVRPPPPPGPAFLPVPVPVAIPYVRPPAEPGVILPPRGVPGSYARPRPYARGPNGDGLVVQAAPAPAAQAQPAPALAAPVQAPPAPTTIPVPPAGARPRPAPPVQPAPAAPSLPQPPAPVSPRAPTLPVPPSHALPVPPQPAASQPAPPASPHALPGARPPAVAPQAAEPQPPAPPTVAPVPHGAGAHPPRLEPEPPPAAPAEAAPPPVPPKPERRPGAPGEPRPRSPDLVAPAEAPPPHAAPAAQPHPPAARPRPQPDPAPRPAPERPPEPPHAAAPADAAPPARRAPDGSAPERPPATRPAPERAAGDHRPGEHPPGEHGPGGHRQGCGHPGEPPCRP
ncbi:caspase family protein [Lichenibacterium dinghuense]|uniref:caspase family protein n=1 Tax=Lichenibacterium dinghuense TaxID=2895977 RepID=UPI00272EAB4E|nr:caspase family protein [Lichenibacterium sp. 6Y81]